jgi:hypothetical protein
VFSGFTASSALTPDDRGRCLRGSVDRNSAYLERLLGKKTIEVEILR